MIAQPNEFGVWLPYREVPIPAPKGITIIVNLAEGADGLFRCGYTLRYSTTGCSSCAPSEKWFGAFATEDEAVLAVACHLEELLDERGDYARAKKALQDFIRQKGPLSVVHQFRPATGSTAYIFGWRHGGDGHQLYVRIRSEWCVTDHIEEAFRFCSLDDCIDFWRRIHANPADYEHCITDGYLQYFKITAGRAERTMPPRQQLTLF